jgi:hypothetical protein
MIFGPRKPITDYERVYCDEDGTCISLEMILPIGADHTGHEICLPCETEKIHGSYDSLTIEDIIDTNLSKSLPGDDQERSFTDLIHEESAESRHIPQTVHQLFMM